MARKSRETIAWHHRRCPDAAMAMPLIEFHCKQCNRRFRSAIGKPWVVGLLFKIRIIEIDIGNAMRLGRQQHQAPLVSQQRRDAIDQGKMPKVIDAKLKLKAVSCPAK